MCDRSPKLTPIPVNPRTTSFLKFIFCGLKSYDFNVIAYAGLPMRKMHSVGGVANETTYGLDNTDLGHSVCETNH